ncbi:MAG: hypothetical protein Q8P22_13425 [Chloroflexota bacterium]|nr:hypothetical protein [Chloroflexota bacterium]
MPTFRVYYKGYYHEHSEWNHTDVEARDELSALRKFFRERRAELREADLLHGAQLPSLASLDPRSEYRWWEGDWLEVYRGIEKVDVAPCPVCEGEGELPRAVANEFGQRILSAR